MAALLRGLSRAETAALTDAMLHSGQVLDLSEFSAPKIDKHSTGGVGDKTSLVLAPLAAAGGLVVPMISGRGLGHTGGTLDKLESIPGFQVGLSIARFREVLRACGCAMIGQTAEIAPADRMFYSLRDVTGTVESPYLICASIMSKKLAEGIDGLVLDVKTGSGAFMKTEEDAAFLAELMVETGQRMGKKMVALITDMDQPLGLRVGNALEVEEVLDVLRGRGPEDLRELCLELAAWMFHLGGRAGTIDHGQDSLRTSSFNPGQALEKFREMVELQGGDAGVIDDPQRLPRAKHSLDVVSSPRAATSARSNARLWARPALFWAAAARRRKIPWTRRSESSLHKKVADRVAAGESLCTIHYNSETRAAQAKKLLEQSYQIADSPPAPAAARSPNHSRRRRTA